MGLPSSHDGTAVSTAEQSAVDHGGAQERSRASGVLTRKRRRFRLYEPISPRAYLMLAVSGLAIVGAVWSVLSYGGLVTTLFLPTPSQVWQAAVSEINQGILLPDVEVSVFRIVVGFVISTALAVPIGVLMGAYKPAEAFIEPTVDFVRYMPAVAFIPLSLIWFGTSLDQKLVILFIGIFFQEVLLVMDNVKTVPRALVEMAYTLGFRPRVVLSKVVVRAALPGIVDTLRISMGWAWTYLVVAELVGANSGLGFQIEQAQRYLDTPEILLGIIVIGILGLIFDFGFKAIYAKSFPYMTTRR